jgi:hypothetical protein
MCSTVVAACCTSPAPASITKLAQRRQPMPHAGVQLEAVNIVMLGVLAISRD